MSTKPQSYTGGYRTSWWDIIALFGGMGLFLTLLDQGQLGIGVIAAAITLAPLIKELTGGS